MATDLIILSKSVSSQGGTVSSFALYAVMSNHQSQSHVHIGAEVPGFFAQSPGSGQCVCVCFKGSGNCLIIAQYCSDQPLKGTLTCGPNEQ